MPYAALEACAVTINGQSKRGAKAVCGHCSNVESLHFNTMRSAGKDDDDIVERLIARKFEAIGWKIGNTPKQNRCPKCFTAIKIAAVKKGQAAMDNKVVPINNAEEDKKINKQLEKLLPEVPRSMSRDERRIIFEKLNDVYLSEKSGYSDSWTDEKVAVDLGVPRKWVSDIREDMFGPEINEQTVELAREAKALLAEARAVFASMHKMVMRMEEIEKQLLNPKK